MLPNLPQSVINQIFNNYGDLSKKAWVPVLTNTDKIQCNVNKHSPIYENIRKVLENKQKNPPYEHTLIIDNITQQKNATTFTIIDNSFSFIMYTIYDADENINDNECIGHLFFVFNKLSTRQYFSKGLCNFTNNYHLEAVTPRLLSHVYEINHLQWFTSQEDGSKNLYIETSYLANFDNEDNEILFWNVGGNTMNMYT
jgi:hypothetical protein